MKNKRSCKKPAVLHMVVSVWSVLTFFYNISSSSVNWDDVIFLKLPNDSSLPEFPLLILTKTNPIIQYLISLVSDLSSLVLIRKKERSKINKTHKYFFSSLIFNVWTSSFAKLFTLFNIKLDFLCTCPALRSVQGCLQCDFVR